MKVTPFRSCNRLFAGAKPRRMRRIEPSPATANLSELSLNATFATAMYIPPEGSQRGFFTPIIKIASRYLLSVAGRSTGADMEYSIGFAKKEEAFASFKGLVAPVLSKWANASGASRTETGDLDLPVLARFQEKR